MLLLGVLFAVQLNAQCYMPRIEKANAAYARGDYRNAYIQYDSALKCPDVRENGRLAREGKAKCQPILTINGKNNLDVNVSSSSGNKTFDVKSIRLSSWHASTNNNEGITINPSVYNGTLTLSWDANAQSTPREWLITISGEGGVEESYATIKIIQAKSSFTVNGQTKLERSFSWEGGAARFDVSGILAGQDYTISDIDTTWMSVQKKDDHFFLIVYPNDSKVSGRNRNLTVSCNNQNVIIKVLQSDCRNKEDLKAKARINLGGLKGNSNSMFPFRKKGIAGMVDQTGEIIYLFSSQLLLSQMDINPYKFDIFNKFDLPNEDMLLPITPKCFIKTSQKNGQYMSAFYYLSDNKLTEIRLLTHPNSSNARKINVYIFQNLDFAIMYPNPSSEHNGISIELYKSDGTIVHKDSSYLQPECFEDGIAITHKSKDNSIEQIIITRNGAIFLMPSVVYSINAITEGVVLYCNKANSIYDQKIGYCHLNGEIITKPRYVCAAPFSNGYALVYKDYYNCYFIDKKGNNHFYKNTNTEKRSFSDGLFCEGHIYFADFYNVKYERESTIKLGIEERIHNKVIDDVDYRFNEGIAMIRVKTTDKNYNNKLSYCNIKGKIITDKEFITAQPFKNGLARATVDRKSWCVLNRNGWTHEIRDQFNFPPSYNPDGTATFNGLHTLQTVDSLGNIFDGNNVDFIVVGNVSVSPTIFSVNNVYGYFNDTLGIVTIPPSFNDALPFSEDLAAVKIGSKWGYIDKTGEIVIPTVFEQARPFNNGRADVVIDEKKYFIDRKGTILND